MVNVIDLQEDWLNHIVSNKLKPRIREQMNQILLPTSEEVINHDHFISPTDKLINKMASDETSSTGDNDSQSLASDTDGNTTGSNSAAGIESLHGRRGIADGVRNRSGD